MKPFWDRLRITPQFSVFRSSLRARVAIGVAFPVFISLIGLSLVHYWQDTNVLGDQARSYAAQLGDILNTSISHTMLIKDSGHLLTTLTDVNRLDIVQQVQIVGVSGNLLAASGIETGLGPLDQLNSGCWECHQFSANERPRSVELREPIETLRISTTISNQPECRACHQETSAHLGVLLIDISLNDIKAHTNQALYRNLTISIFSTVLITMGVYWLMNRLVVRRIEAFREPIAAYAAGDHSARIEKCEQIYDEICQLGATFNDMADEIEQHTLEQEERGKVRQKAIVEERERIARELHDGLAQVLGYVGTKVMAVRLNLQKDNVGEADRQLCQLEEAARGVSLDVREGILGLKMASQVDTDLVAALKEYIRQYNNLSDVHADLQLPSDVLVSLMPEEVLHLLRIVQEALTNSRKHAHASQAFVTLEKNNGTLFLEVRDNGTGFNLQSALEKRNGNFGITTMQERAEEIGANIDICAQPGEGTSIIVKFELEGERN
jgi:signal transduction histidine kinase